MQRRSVTTSRRAAAKTQRAAMETLETRQLLSTVYVDAHSTATTPDGTSWANAFTDLQQALTVAVSGDQIHVAQGTYKPTNTTDRTISFQLKTGVEIDGGYAGVTSATPDARDIEAYPTILSGDIAAIGTNTDNSYHVVVGSGTDATAILDGVTITGGHANGTGTNQSYGGGMLDASGSPTLTNCIVLENLGNSGAGIYNLTSSTPTLTGCRFADNDASSGGGAIFNDHSSPNVTNCFFLGNDGGGGGAIYNISSSPTFVNCAFSGNVASIGAAIGNYSSKARLINCTIAGNIANERAGSVDDENSSSATTLTSCILWGNNAPTYPEIFSSNAVVSYSDVEHGYSGARAIDPLFFRNPSPGADGQWGTADDDFGDLSLQPCSPVADAGNGSAVPSGITTDLAGNSRFQDIPTTINSGGVPVDMGAYEAVPSLFVSAGGTYSIAQGKSITLIAHGASDVAGSLQYAWDLNGDGAFDDSTSSYVIFSNTSSIGTIRVAVRMTDAGSRTVTSVSSIIVVRPVLEVDASAPGPAHDGSSWTNAYNDLQQALTAAVAGQQIHIAHGTYLPSHTLNYYASFQLKSDVAIYGGYAGYGASVPDARDVTVFKTTLSGNLGSSGNGIISSHHVINGSYTNSDAILDGVSITGGYANGAYKDVDGGGMLNISGNPTLNNCIFANNVAETDGGAIANYSSSPVLSSCTFCYNISDFYGGGVYNDGLSSPSFNSCTFTSNYALYGGGASNDTGAHATFNDCIFSTNTATTLGDGGGIQDSGSSITNCAFTNNTAGDQGGGIIVESASIITSCTFTANSADTGGGIYNRSSAQITDCTFTDNSAGAGGGIENGNSSSPIITNSRLVGNSANDGGGIASFDSRATLNDCSFIGNSAITSGGGMYISESTSALGPVNVTNCSFVGNVAELGAGIYVVSDASYIYVHFINCSIISNSASRLAGGIYSQAQSTYAGVSLNNCIIWGNVATFFPQADAVGGVFTLTCCDFQSAGVATNGNITTDPLLYRNPSPGADGAWGTSDDDYGDLRLLPNSPCIDAGSNNVVLYGVTTDIAGNPRIVDFPGVKTPGAIVDMGAYEANTNLGDLHLSSGQNVILPPGHYIFSATQLILDPGATLDLKDDSLVVDYTGASPLGSWNGSAYTGIEGSIASGDHGGTGIITSAANGHTTLAVAEASDVLGLSGSQTTIWNGQTVDATAVVIKYTYAGDANLDGKVNGDDYFAIDSHVTQNGTIFGWTNGDFNYDGKINGDDYFQIDSTINQQGAPLAAINPPLIDRPDGVGQSLLFSSASSVSTKADRDAQLDALLDSAD